MSTLAIEGIKLYAYHGCLPEEQITGGHFTVDVYIDLDTSKAEISDDLRHTVDYQEVNNIVKSEMAVYSKLIEHAGRRIIGRLNAQFSQAENIRVRVTKLHPPVNGMVEKVSVLICSK